MIDRYSQTLMPQCYWTSPLQNRAPVARLTAYAMWTLPWGCAGTFPETGKPSELNGLYHPTRSDHIHHVAANHRQEILMDLEKLMSRVLIVLRDCEGDYFCFGPWKLVQTRKALTCALAILPRGCCSTTTGVLFLTERLTLSRSTRGTTWRRAARELRSPRPSVESICLYVFDETWE